jgi:hypothetical protein
MSKVPCHGLSTMNVRNQVQDAASWYFTHVDPSIPNYENVQRYLRGPLIALTINNVLPATSTTTSKVASMPQVAREEEEEKKSGSNNDWRDYLTSPTAVGPKEPDTPESASTQANEKAREAYHSLSRRTQARMEAFLAGCALAAPIEVAPNSNKHTDHQTSDIVSLQEGLSGFGITSASSAPPKKPTPSSSLIRNMSAVSSSPQQHPQIQHDDLLLRLDLYIRTLQRVKNLGEDCVIAMEPPKAIKARARVITHAFVATAGTVRNLRHVLTRLLNCLTMEVLAVEVLSEDVTKIIRRIASEYEHGTSFASLAFLSTPEVNADSLLTPLIVKYLRYLQTSWEQVISNCELERMLTRALNSEMRKLFKTIEFRSIGHLLEVCHEQRAKLQHIELAPHVCAVADNINNLIHSKEALRQALRDLQREIITVNGHVLPPVSSRKELLNILRQTLNSRTLTAAERPRRRRTGGKKGQQMPRSNSVEALGQNNPPANGVATPSAKENMLNTPATPKSMDDSDHLFSSEAESDAHDISSISGGDTSPPSGSKVRRRNFHLSTIDLLTRRLLIAASRTGNGGDAYFIVRDLFGGEDVEVIPTNSLPLQNRNIRPATIDIVVRLASVTIKCHQSFDIYPKSLVGDCEPLVQFHTTTTETISLQEVRSSDSADEDDFLRTPDRPSGSAMLVLQEQDSSRAGWRTISIRPAIYEKVDVPNYL